MKTKITILLIIICFSSAFAQVKQNEILSKDSTGNPTFIKFQETSVQSSDTSIKSFLSKQYNLKSNNNFKTKKGSENINKGIKTQKLEQYYNGIKIEFNEIVVASKNDKVKTINGKGLNIKNLNTTPKLSESEALNHLLKKINAKKYAWEDKSYEELLKKETQNVNATNFPTGELLIMDKNLFDDKFVPVLVYKFNVYAIKPLSKAYYYVDASSGDIILEDAIIKHIQGTAYTRYSGQRTIETEQSGGSYRLRDYSRGNGVETYNMNNGTSYTNAMDFTDNDNVWTTTEFHNSSKDDAALDAHWGAEMTYDYFYQKHNRNSYDNNGGVLRNYIHANLVGMGYTNNDNAFWDGSRMTYGDGQYSFDALTSVDVIGHEIAHGVCSKTANLVYQNEPGALNEGLSDIWGAMVEYFADPTKQTYEIGEDITLGGGSLRSMSNPNSRNQPDTYNGTYWYTGSGDYGGVHTNSGVLNYWFYLLAEGGSGTNDIGNSFNVGGIGKEKASKIVYRAENVYFTSTTTYSQARLLTIQSAEDLYGVGSIEAATTCQSWFSVGVGDNNCTLNAKLSGSNSICSTSNSMYTLNYTPNNVVWSTSANLQILSQNSTSITVKPISSSINGNATITANINGTFVTKNIWVGKPIIQIIKQNYDPNYPIAYDVAIKDANVQDITNVLWQKVSGQGTISQNQDIYSANVGGGTNDWIFNGKVTATNNCGSTIKYFTVSGGGNPPSGGGCFSISSDGIISMVPSCLNNLNGFNTNNLNPRIKNVSVYNSLGQIMEKANSNSINLTYLNKGIYFLHITLNNGEIITKKIIK